MTIAITETTRSTPARAVLRRFEGGTRRRRQLAGPLMLLGFALSMLAACTRPTALNETQDPARSNISLVRHYYTTWGVDMVDESMRYIDRDAVLHGPCRGSSINSWLEGQLWLTMTAPSAKFSVEGMVAHGDRVSVSWTLHGVDENGWLTGTSGQEFTFSGTSIERVAQGKIVELWWPEIPAMPSVRTARIR